LRKELKPLEKSGGFFIENRNSARSEVLHDNLVAL